MVTIKHKESDARASPPYLARPRAKWTPFFYLFRAQVLLFGRWKVEGVVVRGSISYRLTNPSRRGSSTWVGESV